jgi:hypothetical protein
MITTRTEGRLLPIILSGLFLCTEWRAHFTSEKLQAITDIIVDTVKESCQCQKHIFATLHCLNQSSNSIIYTAIVTGASDLETSAILDRINSWVSSGPTISVLGVLMRVGEECTENVTNLDSGVCSRNEMCSREQYSCNKTQSSPTGSDTGENIGIAISAAVAGILVGGALVAIPFCIMKCRQSRLQAYNVKDDMPTSTNAAYAMTSISDRQRAESMEHSYDVIKNAHALDGPPPPCRPRQMTALDGSYEIHTPPNIRQMRVQQRVDTENDH